MAVWLFYEINILLSKAQKPKLQLTWRALGPDPILSPTHFPVDYVTTSTMKKKRWYSKAEQRAKFHFPNRKENLRLCLGNTWLIFGQDL